MTEQEEFWENESFLVVTDNTRPAMKWTADELKKKGKRVYVLDLSDKSEGGGSAKFSGIPADLDCAVIGLTKSAPLGAVEEVMKLGIKKLWIHWGTDAGGVRERCQEIEAQCIVGRCPMMYLSANGLNMHSVHKAVAKILRKY